ncbi:beta carboxy-cis-cis-muconate lactonizing enzyme, cyloisomerase, CLME2 [Viridothelium virens]|uniref:Beta carboxy-cis-cis-muconate lactonizing enzyme, cyloisomerase, CLME2 n=1 Tax=Viridothelium virens TaxID=1048519 RepID=A0A6A6H1L1_VIRVR|nr:beta carboxy-cis-cis-muconate lactonizing enzyme, cyloisomerase, CLME2 [Viridothelium virens]
MAYTRSGFLAQEMYSIARWSQNLVPIPQQHYFSIYRRQTPNMLSRLPWRTKNRQMTTMLDSDIFHNVFNTAETSKIWSDETRTSYYLDFEAALATVQARLNIIPQKAADEIAKVCKWEEIDVEQLRKKTELIGYPVLPVVQQLVKKVNMVEDRLGEWTHWGATTQDLTDTATVLQLRDTLDIVDRKIAAIVAALEKLCEKYRTAPMAARSNLQQAVPISFGFKAARLLASFQRHQARLRDLRPRLLVLEFSGAAGTLATLSPTSAFGPAPPPRSPSEDKPLGLRCQDLLAAELGLRVPLIAWHTERDSIAEIGNAFAILTATCAKFATDLKLMMQTEVGEAREPYVAHRGSSSTMPQKRNPIGCAYICAMSSSVRSMANGLVEAVVADHERSTGPWEIEWIMLPQVCCLTVAILAHTQYLLEGLEVDEDAMRKNLAMTRGKVVSEAVMMGLGKKLGRQYAHDLVYEVCRKADVDGRPLVDLLLENEKIENSGVGEEEIRSLCDPGNYLGLSAEMVDLVVKNRQR